MFAAQKRQQKDAAGRLKREWWEVRIPLGERGRRKTFTASTRRVAEAKARDWFAAHGAQVTHYVDPKLTLGDAVRAVIPQRAVEPSTVKRQLDAWKACAGKLDTLQVAKLTRTAVIRWRDQLSRNRDAQIAVQVGALTLDKFPDALPSNPFRELPPLERVRAESELEYGARRIKIFLPEEVAALKRATWGHRIPGLLFALFDLGLRPAEAIALKWGDIKWNGTRQRHEIDVQRMVRGGKLSMRLKTKNSRRTIGVTESTLVQFGPEGAPDDLVFRNEAGGIVDLTSHDKWLIALHNRAGVDVVKGRAFYACRHTHASQLIAEGVPLTDVAARLGHSVPTLLRYYSHWISNEDRTSDAVRAMSGMPRRANGG